MLRKTIHIAIPSRYVAREIPPHEAREVSLRMGCGPWAARRFAASLYAQGWARIPSAWDWAAQFRTLGAPLLFDGALGYLRLPTSAVSPPLGARGGRSKSLS